MRKGVIIAAFGISVTLETDVVCKYQQTKFQMWVDNETAVGVSVCQLEEVLRISRWFFFLLVFLILIIANSTQSTFLDYYTGLVLA